MGYRLWSVGLVPHGRWLPAFTVTAGVFLAAPALAHHSRAMFDMGKNITYRGVVQEYRWQNPHSHIVITIGAGAADPTTVGTWTVEASAINLMTTKNRPMGHGLW